MSTDRVSEWPKHRACVPYNGQSRVVGFVIEPGDEAYGKHGLSEPLFWLDRMCKKAALPEPVHAGAVDALERCSAKLRDISIGLPIGVFDKGASEHLAETAAEIDAAIAALRANQSALPEVTEGFYLIDTIAFAGLLVAGYAAVCLMFAIIGGGL